MDINISGVTFFSVIQLMPKISDFLGSRKSGSDFFFVICVQLNFVIIVVKGLEKPL